MNSLRITLYTTLIIVSLTAHASQPTINLSIEGEVSPGVYGQVQFGNAPPPPVLYPEPMIIVPQQAHVRASPLYLHVPPGHARSWSRYCRRYDACNRPVYFVRSREYEPGYSVSKEKSRKHEEKRHGHSDER